LNINLAKFTFDAIGQAQEHGHRFGGHAGWWCWHWWGYLYPMELFRDRCSVFGLQSQQLASPAIKRFARQALVPRISRHALPGGLALSKMVKPVLLFGCKLRCPLIIRFRFNLCHPVPITFGK
jgi:hypothetical protein